LSRALIVTAPEKPPATMAQGTMVNRKLLSRSSARATEKGTLRSAPQSSPRKTRCCRRSESKSTVSCDAIAFTAWRAPLATRGLTSVDGFTIRRSLA
jgi:hypothetical protein